jgi:exosome complex component RRP41
MELAHNLQSAISSTLLTNLFPHSTLTISLHVLAQDGGLLAACINAATLALIDAGVPMYDYLVACSAGSSSASATAAPSSATTQAAETVSVSADVDDPLLDLNGLEEQELPYLTVGTLGASDKVVTLVMETRCHASRMEEMLAVGVSGCKRIRNILDDVVRAHGKRMIDKE